MPTKPPEKNQKKKYEELLLSSTESSFKSLVGYWRYSPTYHFKRKEQKIAVRDDKHIFKFLTY